MTLLDKKPLQVYLRRDQLAALRSLARRRDVSMAELVRQGVDRLLVDVPIEEDPLFDLINLFDSGHGKLSEEHDRYLIEARDNPDPT